jgi:hypothetical protein
MWYRIKLALKLIAVTPILLLIVFASLVTFVFYPDFELPNFISSFLDNIEKWIDNTKR